MYIVFYILLKLLHLKISTKIFMRRNASFLKIPKFSQTVSFHQKLKYNGRNWSFTEHTCTFGVQFSIIKSLHDIEPFALIPKKDVKENRKKLVTLMS